MATVEACKTEESLGTLLRHPAIWRGRVRQNHASCGHASGYPELDRQLPGQGWPRAGLVEILCDRNGMGELQLLMPLLARLSQQDNRWISWVRPPFIPYAPALASQSVQLEKLLWVRTRNDRESLWATHQSLGSGNCSLVMGWIGKDVLASESRRLQVSASDSDTLGILFRPTAASCQSSCATLRLRLRPTVGGLRLETLKSRGSWPAKPMDIRLNQAPGFHCDNPETPPVILPDRRHRHTRTQHQSDLFGNGRPVTHVPALPDPNPAGREPLIRLRPPEPDFFHEHDGSS